MSSVISQSNDLKITVKLTMRVPIKSTEDLLSRNLGEVYQQCLQKLGGKNYNEKRFSTKLRANSVGLSLAKGSWWHYGPIVSTLLYQNILQFSSCPGRPAKILLLITTDDRSRTELVLVKTKGINYANLLLAALQRSVLEAHQRLSYKPAPLENTDSRPVTYQLEERDTASVIRRSSVSSSSLTPTQKIETPMAKTSEETQKQRDLHQKGTASSQITGEIRVKPLTVEMPIPPERLKKMQSQKKSENQRDEDSKNEINGYTGNYTKTSYDPETKIETLDSVVYYGQQTEWLTKAKNNNKPKKPKSRAPRELSMVGNGRKVTREVDENNIPWEVNICYIKHDPLVGCVEDESGPIYMYTAHQLVSREEQDYDIRESDESDPSSSSAEEDSADESSCDSMDSSDENKELEKFMMLGRSNHTTELKNGNAGSLGEIYEY
ncbi:unnamed protein product [Mesocestoides corti]|uniref:Uncharacterized protein n=1 Tax=Mesocestoides corti TaxID=53468 RepID=A0A0R3UGI3_MESCO|nr:unnamed protein product [Mesocestoides corti]